MTGERSFFSTLLGGVCLASLVTRPEEWPWPSVSEYGFEEMADARHEPALRIDRVRIPADEKTRI
jgi:hypothetical protein